MIFILSSFHPVFILSKTITSTVMDTASTQSHGNNAGFGKSEQDERINKDKRF